MRAVCGAVVAMLVPETLRNQYLDRLAEQFFALIPKELLRLRIDQNDSPVRVYDHHSIRRGIQQTAKQFVGTLPVGDVPNYSADQ